MDLNVNIFYKCGSQRKAYIVYFYWECFVCLVYQDGDFYFFGEYVYEWLCSVKNGVFGIGYIIYNNDGFVFQF